jgi:hypothetical protein
MIRVDRGAQVFKPSPSGLVGHGARTGRDAVSLVVFIRRTGGPVNEVVVELRNKTLTVAV